MREADISYKSGKFPEGLFRFQLTTSLMGDPFLYNSEIAMQVDDVAADAIKLFVLYYAKMLYNLNRGLESDGLIKILSQMVNEAISIEGFKPTSALPNNIKLLEAKGDKPNKTYIGKLYQHKNGIRTIETHVSIGEERYYAPLSVLAYLEYLLQQLDGGAYGYLLMSIKGMSEYYTIMGDYSKMNSILEASTYGFMFANKVLIKK